MAADLRCPPVLDKDREGVGYAAFWPTYLAAHADPRTRGLHYLGTALALAALARAGAEKDWRWLLAAPVLGYAPAWFGHAVFEGNRPQTFGHPLWSLASDLRMLGLFATGRLGAALRRAGAARGE
ncbi:MAG TPA: DUF962 domain-containing protein [Stellaceae bacterium]|nr:DUF962 domain-containing protein [Stellaceae bacterium]